MELDLVTAGEFRARGAVIDTKIPDHATVPRASVRITPQVGAEWVQSGEDTYTITMVTTFTMPFTWDPDVPAPAASPQDP